MKLAIVITLSALLLILGTQIYSFLGRERQVRDEYLDFKAKLDKAKFDQSKFQSELNYYLNPANLEKELRARFNYRAPDEKLLIIVPRTGPKIVSSTGGQ